MLNRVILIGYVGNDAEVRVLESGIKTATFRLATNEAYVRGDGSSGTHVEWHSIVAWREVATTAERLALRGAELCVEGAIRSRSAIDPKSKQERTLYEIVAHAIRPANDAAPLTKEQTTTTDPLIAVAKDPDGLPF